MSLADIIGEDMKESYLLWYDSVATNYTYEQWIPSANYSELTLNICTINDTVISLRTFPVVGDLRGFYEELEANGDEESICNIPETETLTATTAKSN